MAENGEEPSDITAVKDSADYNPKSPFLDSLPIAEQDKDTDSTPDTSDEVLSPFESYYDSEYGEEQLDPEEEMLHDLLAELEDPEFDSAVYELQAEASQILEDDESSDDECSEAELESLLQHHFAPLLGHIDSLVDTLADEVDRQDPEESSESEIETLLEALTEGEAMLPPPHRRFYRAFRRKLPPVVRAMRRARRRGLRRPRRLRYPPGPAHRVFARVPPRPPRRPYPRPRRPLRPRGRRWGARVRKLKGLARPVLRRALKYGTRTLFPFPYRGIARRAGRKLFGALGLETPEHGIENSAFEAWQDPELLVDAPLAENEDAFDEVSEIQGEFDLYLASLVFDEEDAEQDLVVNEYDHESKSGGPNVRRRLRSARRRLVRRLASLEDGEDPAPAIDEFLAPLLAALPAVAKGVATAAPYVAAAAPVLKGVFRSRDQGGQRYRPATRASHDRPDRGFGGLSRAPRDRPGRGFGGLRRRLPALLARLLLRFLGRNKEPLARALSAMNPKAFSDARPEQAEANTAAATVDVVEDTVRQLAAENEALLTDEVLPSLVEEAFEKAMIGNYPARPEAPDSYESELPGVWLSTSMSGRKYLPYKRFHVQPQLVMTITPDHLRFLRSFGGADVTADGHPLSSLVGREARVHLFEAKQGTRLSDIVREERADGEAQVALRDLAPLSTLAATLLLNSPGLGRDVSRYYLARPSTIGVGQRFFALELEGQTPAEADEIEEEYSELRLSRKLSTGRQGLSLYLNDPSAKRLLELLENGKYTASYVHIKRALLNAKARNPWWFRASPFEHSGPAAPIATGAVLFGVPVATLAVVFGGIGLLLSAVIALFIKALKDTWNAKQVERLRYELNNALAASNGNGATLTWYALLLRASGTPKGWFIRIPNFEVAPGRFGDMG